MNRCYWKFCGTGMCVAAALLALSGCSTRSSRVSEQTYTTTPTTYASQPPAEASGTMAMNQGAPVYQSDSQWQAGYVQPRQSRSGQPMNEAAGAQVTTQQTQNQNLAPVEQSNSQWQSADSQTLQSPRASNQGWAQTQQGQAYDANAYDSGTRAQVQTRATTRSSASMNASTTTPMYTEGPNSGGKWRPGFQQPTLGPEASTATGWLPGYYNPNFNQQTSTMYEAAGSQRSWGNHEDLQQQINRQQQQINEQQRELNQLRHQLHQQGQPAPSNNSTTP